MPLTDDQALGLYIQEAESRAKAAVCALHDSKFGSEFDRRFAAWRQANAADLERGAKLAKAKGMDGTEPTSVQAFAHFGAAILDSIPDDDRRRRCGELLELLRVGPTK